MELILLLLMQCKVLIIYREKCLGKQWGLDSSVAFPIGVKGRGPIGQTLRHFLFFFFFFFENHFFFFGYNNVRTVIFTLNILLKISKNIHLIILNITENLF